MDLKMLFAHSGGHQSGVACSRRLTIKLFCFCLLLFFQKASTTLQLQQLYLFSKSTHSQLITILNINHFDYWVVTVVSFTKAIASTLACVRFVIITRVVREQIIRFIHILLIRVF